MEPDIADRIRRDFAPSDIPLAKALLEESGNSGGRIARCILVASNGNVERLRQHIRIAELDFRDAIHAGEYDASFRQLRDLRVSFLIDAPEKFG